MTAPAPDRLVLAAGLQWLYQTVQPDGAIIQHHGTSRLGMGGRLYSFMATGVHDLPVIAVTHAGLHRDPETDQIDSLLEPGEMAAYADAIAQLGGNVRETWNGDGCVGGGFGLVEPAHPSLVAAVARYQAGCPKHHTVFCRELPAGERCTWYSDGFHQIVDPAW